MYITPNTDIIILHGVPLESNLEHTILFSSWFEQQSYFLQKAKYTLTNQSYQRKSKCRLRISQHADNLLDCNYLMFKNTSYGNKWFYAFISDVIYINDSVCEVIYIIDVLQTWLFDFSLSSCYVEREHVPLIADMPGAYRLDEGLEHGDYIYYEFMDTSGDTPKPFFSNVFEDWAIVVLATFDKNLNSASGGMRNGVYSGLAYNVFSGNTMAVDVNTFLQNAASNNKADGIISIFMAPTYFADNATRIRGIATINGFPQYHQNYTPKNNKLCQYPYMCITATDMQNDSINYKYEDFSNNDTRQFRLYGVCNGTNEFMIYPRNYQGVQENYMSKILVNVTPQCSWSSDAYAAWLAQNSAKMRLTRENIAYQGKVNLLQAQDAVDRTVTNAGIDMASGLGSSVASAIGTGQIGGIVGGIGNAVKTTSNEYFDLLANFRNQELIKTNTQYNLNMLLAEQTVASTMPNLGHGQESGAIGITAGYYGLHLYQSEIRKEYAERIDGYFERYGYKVNELKVPNIHTRPYWNYIKTCGCQLNASIPEMDATTIRGLFDRGITFWHHSEHFMDYSQNNHAVSQTAVNAINNENGGDNIGE